MCFSMMSEMMSASRASANNRLASVNTSAAVIPSIREYRQLAAAKKPPNRGVFWAQYPHGERCIKTR